MVVTTVAIAGDEVTGASCGGAQQQQQNAATALLPGYNTFRAKKDKGGSPNDIIAATSGIVEVIDRVVSVKTLSPRYMPEIGDVVVGRIVEVIGNRWKCNVNGLLDAFMLLSNVTEPGGILRRRGRDDELSMRNLFCEGDLFVAEVQRISPDGLISLHTRAAEKYGKLTSMGTLVKVRPSIVRRVRRHFHTFSKHGVTMIIGMNGNLWVTQATEAQLREAAESRQDHDQDAEHQHQQAEGGDDEKNAATVDERAIQEILDPVAQHLAVARFANCATVMNAAMIVISPATVELAVSYSLERSWKPYDILVRQNSALLVTAIKTEVAAMVGGVSASTGGGEHLLHHIGMRQLKRARTSDPQEASSGVHEDDAEAEDDEE